MVNQAIPFRPQDHRILLALCLLLVIILAGVRFNDGTTMLAISHGATISDPAFNEPESHIVLDSPLKVFLLHALPAKILVIAFAFCILALLPATPLASRESRTIWLTIAVLFLTPALKISVQNIGYGDGLIVFLTMLPFFKKQYRLVFGAFLVIGLWHPQQSFFIGISFLLGRYCYSDTPFDRREALTVAGSLACAAAIYWIYKSSLGYHYNGREPYMLAHMTGFLRRNPAYLVIAFAPSAIWFALLAPRPIRGGLMLMGWLLVLSAISLLTSDVTRVITMITLPIILAGATRAIDELPTVAPLKIAVAAIVIALIPAFSWAGLDVFLWSDLGRMLCKWESFCL